MLRLECEVRQSSKERKRDASTVRSAAAESAGVSRVQHFITWDSTPILKKRVGKIILNHICLQMIVNLSTKALEIVQCFGMY
ncbi:hypothetical protein MATL_G00111560 [Megalops atlanticus]|uniref:Uncharacterized protein n=1 Tax=Megalops atlanticus TaxID=7932 RepID=A0A9D3T603_MEGAT|nr:hypothetical protein MATL_G00111560 [Megalops atlanticus]